MGYRHWVMDQLRQMGVEGMNFRRGVLVVDRMTLEVNLGDARCGADVGKQKSSNKEGGGEK